MPGAKLPPTTTKGPEAPFIERPGLGSPMFACPLPDSSAVRSRSAFGRRLTLCFERVRADATVAGAGFDCFVSLVWKDADAECYNGCITWSEQTGRNGCNQELVIPLAVRQSDWPSSPASHLAPCSPRLVPAHLLVGLSCSCSSQGAGLPIAHFVSFGDLDARVGS